MPAHITHTVFADRATRTILGRDNILSGVSAALALGAQGPDMFLHNQRTYPSAFQYGKDLHVRGYGRGLSAMARELVGRSEGAAIDPASPEGAFLIGFTTHAILDRHTHAYIIYFSGWVDPKREETKKFHQCHAFFERLLDVLTLHRYTDSSIATYDFFSRVDCGETLPAEFNRMLASGVSAAVPGARDDGNLSAKIDNAYLDTRYFYDLSNPPAVDNLAKAYSLDLGSDFRVRYLALFHPHTIDSDLDFSNESHREWLNPCEPQGPNRTARTDSFFDLFAEAEREAEEVLPVVVSILEGREKPEKLEDLVGNTNLNDGKTEEPCLLTAADPFPLPEMIEEIYRRFR